MRVDKSDKHLLKIWDEHVEIGQNTMEQARNIASMPFIFRWASLMPDAHLGKGATVGSVIPTHKAIIPAAVGVDIGCGMMAVKTSLNASDLPESLKSLRSKIEELVPVGFSKRIITTPSQAKAWMSIVDRYNIICDKYPDLRKANSVVHMGTLGGGNHFIEICLDENEDVWIMLHSGSRGIGNAIGKMFIEKAKEEMRRFYINLPDEDLAYLPEGSKYFADYVEALNWAQDFARLNREVMMEETITAMREFLPEFTLVEQAINCHHNYTSIENHYGNNIYVTRKGAIRAREGDLGIIPGSMGTRSYIVRGKGNEESFCSCSHGAGRNFSRNEARKMFTVEDHIKATEGVECRKDENVIDETPAAYKDIDKVMASQSDLVDIVYTLKQILCVKG